MTETESLIDSSQRPKEMIRCNIVSSPDKLVLNKVTILKLKITSNMFHKVKLYVELPKPSGTIKILGVEKMVNDLS